MSEILMATRRQARELVDGTIEVKLHIDPRYKSSFHKLFPEIDMPVALAPLNIEASKKHAQSETIEDKPKGGFLSQWLAMRCNEPEFWRFLDNKFYNGAGLVDNFDFCDEIVKGWLQIESKTELDNNENAAARFHSEIRQPYAKWLAGARIAV